MQSAVPHRYRFAFKNLTKTSLPTAGGNRLEKKASAFCLPPQSSGRSLPWAERTAFLTASSRAGSRAADAVEQSRRRRTHAHTRARTHTHTHTH